MSDRDAWQPPDGVTAHDGTPLPANLDFFVAPPAEIGPVLSAYSTILTGRGPWWRWLRVLRTTLIGLAGGSVVGYFIPGEKLGPTGTSILIGVLAAGFAFMLGMSWRGPACCHYVGRDGVAFFGWHGRRRVAGPRTMLLFRDARSVVTSFVDHHHNGVFTGTQYSFTWDRPSAGEPYKFKGVCPHKKRPLPTGESLLFGHAAERAWNVYEYPRLVEQFGGTGEARFDLEIRKGDYILVTPDLIELQQKGQLSSISIVDVEGFDVDQGVVILRLVGAKKAGHLSREQGIFSLPYARIANGQLFLMLLGSILQARSTQSG